VAVVWAIFDTVLVVTVGVVTLCPAVKLISFPYAVPAVLVAYART
jgi:hypothetical protein